MTINNMKSLFLIHGNSLQADHLARIQYYFSTQQLFFQHLTPLDTV